MLEAEGGWIHMIVLPFSQYFVNNVRTILMVCLYFRMHSTVAFTITGMDDPQRSKA